MKRLIEIFAGSGFNDISFTRGGFNGIVLTAVAWCLALILMAILGHPLPDNATIGTITGTITGFMAALGVTKHHKEKQQ